MRVPSQGKDNLHLVEPPGGGFYNFFSTQASKDSPKQLRAIMKITSTGPTGPVKHFGTFLLTSFFPQECPPNIFEINQDKVNKNRCQKMLYNVFLLLC